MRLATLPLLNDQAYSALDVLALRLYFLQHSNPLLALYNRPDCPLAGIVSAFTEPRRVVAQLSDDALLTIARYDLAMVVEELCGDDTSGQTVALQTLIAHIDTRRISGYGAHCLLNIMALALDYYRTEHTWAWPTLQRVRARAYGAEETPDAALPAILPTETMLMTVDIHGMSPDAQRVRRILRTVASDLLAECEALR